MFLWKARLTVSGYGGRLPSGSAEQTKSPCRGRHRHRRPTAAPLVTDGGLPVPPPSQDRWPRFGCWLRVLGDLTRAPPSEGMTDSSTVSRECRQSMSDHRRAHASPLRHPVAAMTRRHVRVAKIEALRLFPSKSARTSRVDGARTGSGSTCRSSRPAVRRLSDWIVELVPAPLAGELAGAVQDLIGRNARSPRQAPLSFNLGSTARPRTE